MATNTRISALTSDTTSEGITAASYNLRVAMDVRPVQGTAILFAKINASSSGSNTIISAVSGTKIKVLGYSLVCDSAVTVKWQSESTDLSGAMSFGANGGISTPMGTPESSWLIETAAGEALNMTLGGAVGVRGHIAYFLGA